MKKTILLMTTVTAFLLMACGGNKEKEKAPAEENKDSVTAENKVTEEETPASPPDSAAMMKAWQEFMTPGPMHKMLAKYDGVFIGEVTTWMNPNTPTTSKSVATNKMIYNGLYQESQHKGDFNGMPFEGMGMTGYDNAKKKFVSTWMDNMGSGIMVTEGDWDEATKTITLIGTSTDPMTGKACAQREIMKFIDDNNYVMEMYGTPPGQKEMKMMEIKFKRK